MWPFDQNTRQGSQQYTQAHESGNSDGIDPMQAISYLLQFMQSAPPSAQQQVYQQHFAQLSPEQRTAVAQQMPPEYGANANDPASLAQGFRQLGQERPDMLEQILSNPLVISTTINLISMAVRYMLEHRHQ